ncbi:MAG: DinB family protein [Bacteroidetes bacterium]|nr:DinB family protein [Bacteroidota bacterium]
MTNRWAVQLDKLTQTYQREFGGLSASQLNWKPNGKTWSIAQNLDHVIKVNETYFPVLDALRREQYRTPLLGRIGLAVRFFGKMVLQAVEPTRRKRMKTMRLWEPAASDLPADIVNRFGAHQQALLAQIADSQDLVRKGAIIASPASNAIVYKLDTAFDIIVSHEERHLAQAREVLALLPVA